jgi:hypothetical protein
MNTRALALALILAFSFSLVVGVQIIHVANANFFPGDAFFISSPTSTKVYTNTSIPLNIVASVANPTPEVVSITYSLDNNPNVTITNLNKTLRLPGHIDGSQFSAESVLENLVEGNHTLKAYSLDASGVQMSASVEFIIDTSFKSPLSVLSPQNATYYTTEVPLIFVSTEEIRRTEDFMMGDYLLDGIGAGYISGNLTLTGLSIGEHQLILYVWTVKGVFSETIYFSIAHPEPFPTTLAIGSAIVVVAVVGVGLLVYFKKRSRKSGVTA